MRVRVFIVSLALVLASASIAAAQLADTPAPPRLVVVVVADGLAQPRLEAWRPWLTGGLGRLLAEGAVFTGARLGHVNGTCGPGHASLATGAPPRVHGVVGQRWFERNEAGGLRARGCAEQAWAPAPGSPPLFYREVRSQDGLFVFAISHVYDEFRATGKRGAWEWRPGYGPKGEHVSFDSTDAVHLFNVRHGRPAEPLATGQMPGPAALRVATLGDRLAEQRYTSRVVALAGRPEGAVLLAGRGRTHAAYWFDQTTGRFETSLAYDLSDPLAAGVRRTVGDHDRTLGARALLDRFGPLWRRLPAPDADPARPLPRPANDLLELQVPRLGLGFDHDLRLHPDGFAAGVASSPLVDELVADLALAVLGDARSAKLGTGTQPDLLLLSFSALHAVAEAYGPDSEEALDTLRRLDVQLGRLLAALDAPPFAGGVLVALASDHGFSDIPEAVRQRSPQAPAGRLVVGGRAPVDALARLNRVLRDELGMPPSARPLLAIDGLAVTYNRAAFPWPRDPADEAAGVIEVGELDTLLPLACARLFAEEIERVVPARLAAEAPETDLAAAAIRASADPARSPNAYLIPRPGVIVHSDPGRGAGCGSHHEPDIHVPLLLWGATIQPGVRAEAVTPYDLAPTLAAILGIQLPDATGRDLLGEPQPAPPAT